jgi:hypothetical protein
MPSRYLLKQNYPNPFNPSTRLEYEIPQKSNVKIVVYNILGEIIKEIHNDGQAAGSYSLSLNFENISSGIYFYSLITEDYSETKKMIILR